MQLPEANQRFWSEGFWQEQVQGEITLAIGNPPAVSRGVRLPGPVFYSLLCDPADKRPSH